MEIWDIVWNWAKLLDPMLNEFAIRKLVAQIEDHIRGDGKVQLVLNANCNHCGIILEEVWQPEETTEKEIPPTTMSAKPRLCDKCWGILYHDFFSF